jgi:hypothetical protein
LGQEAQHRLIYLSTILPSFQRCPAESNLPAQEFVGEERALPCGKQAVNIVKLEISDLA